MGLVYAEIKLINGKDDMLYRKSLIKENEVKTTIVKANIDLENPYLIINNETQSQLKLPLLEKRIFKNNNNELIELNALGPVIVKFKNRTSSCLAILNPSLNETVLGFMRYNDLDVIIHPQSQQLLVNPEHPYIAQMKLK